MIKLKDLLYEMTSPNLLIPRRVEGRVAKYIESKIKQYIKNNNVGDFDISRLGLTKLPASLKDLKIGGSFNCNNNSLTSLTDAPTSVGLHFYCINNKLESLDGLIRDDGVRLSVGGYFYCYNNKVKFTKEQVRAVCDVKGDIFV